MKTKKKLKIKWGNVIKLLIFIGCTSVLLYDFYMVGFSYWFTGYSVSFTWFGLITNIVCLMTASEIYDDFEEQIKKSPVTRNN